MQRRAFLFSGGSDMAARCAAHPWEASPLGAPEGWHAALETLVPIVLASSQPMFVVWGASRTLIYNDAYAAILGSKHPAALGRDFLDVWAEIRDDLEPIVAVAYRGESVQMDDIALRMHRHGFPEEAHFSFVYAPVRAGGGEVAGFFCACTETTAQIMAERRLAESEARHRGVLENMDEGFTLFDRDFTILEVNEATARLVGLQRHELVGASHWERFPGTLESPLGRMYLEVRADRRPRAMEYRYRYPDGRACWYEVRAFPVQEGVAALFRDVTHRRELEAEAAAAVERTRLALEAGAIVGTWMWDVQADRVIADERFATSFGLDPVAVAGGVPIAYAFAAIHPDDRARVEAAVARCIADRSRYRCEYRVLRDGAYRWVEANGRVELDADGRPQQFPGVLLDIEDRRRIEEERDRTAALLRTFIGAVPGAVYAKDRAGRYLLANSGAAEALGVAHGEVIGRTDAEILRDPAEAAMLMEHDRRVMESGETQRVEEAVRRGDGTPAIWWSTKAPLRDAAGEVTGLIGTSVDITERRQMMDALRQADRRKDEFLAMLAHELRNPLAPISTASHILKVAAADATRVREAAEVIGRQVGHMTRLVDDLLDVSRVTRGLVELEQVPVDLRTVVATAVEQVQPLVRGRGHALHTRIGTGSIVVQGDFHRLVQVVSNLLTNAARYTPGPGLIEVRLSAADGLARLEVADNGAGIAPDMLEQVFELFTQAERTPDRTQGGLGIALSLVRSLVRLHGGDVRAHSEGPGRGATFSVSLPLAAATAAPTVPSTPTAAGAGLRVLLVDDNQDALTTLADALALSGHRVHTAGTGTLALAQVATQPAWDACILDIGLPDMTGYALATRLRELPSTREALLVALTGYGQANDRAMATAAGFDAHVVKPADVPTLLGLLDRIDAARPLVHVD